MSNSFECVEFKYENVEKRNTMDVSFDFSQLAQYKIKDFSFTGTKVILCFVLILSH